MNDLLAILITLFVGFLAICKVGIGRLPRR